MAMHRIICPSCGWRTKPHYSIIDCLKEKELAHAFGLKAFDKWYGVYSDAHDSAFTDICPECGKKTKEEFRWFPEKEIKEG
jgi:sarcosine oxidase delta subunit